MLRQDRGGTVSAHYVGVGSCCKDESGMNACIRLPVFLSYDGATRTIPLLLADGDHLEIGSLEHLLIVLLPHGSRDRDLVIVRMGCKEFRVAGDHGFLARLVFLDHILVGSRAFIEAAGDADRARIFLLLIFLFLADNR
jgi:hypothetical protein